jgi:hypothetical protein
MAYSKAKLKSSGDRASPCFRQAVRWKFEGSRPDEVNYFFPIYLVILAVLGPGVYSACNRDEYQKQKNCVSGEESAADNLTAICEPIF